MHDMGLELERAGGDAGTAASPELLPETSSVSEARRFVRQVLADWELEPLVDTVTLLTSELATNAVLHARTPYSVRLGRDTDELRVDVLDGSLGVPSLRHGSVEAATGRGVALVDELSATWGVTPRRVNGFVKSVWFTLPVQGGPDAWSGQDWLAQVDGL